MSCPDWPILVDRRDHDPEGEILWERALEHLDGCRECRADAYAAEPTLVFRRLPAPELTQRDVEAMKNDVAAMRRAQPIVLPAAPARRIQRRRRIATPALMRAAASVAVVAGGFLLYQLVGPAELDPGNAAPAPTAMPEAVLGERSHHDLHFEVHVLRASKRVSAEPAGSADDLSPELVGELQQFLRYTDYEVIAQGELTSREGGQASAALSNGFEVGFEAGTLLSGERVRLQSFQLGKRSLLKGPQAKTPLELFELHLNLTLDRPMTWVLTSDPDDALVLAITCRLADGAAEP